MKHNYGERHMGDEYEVHNKDLDAKDDANIEASPDTEDGIESDGILDDEEGVNNKKGAMRDVDQAYGE